MAAVARLGGVSLDASDPRALATFYRELLELEVLLETEDVVALRGAGILLTAQRVGDHQPSSWPEDGVPKQLHLELAVEDLDAAQARALALGATAPPSQLCASEWRVLLDPAGHPFCLTTQIPHEELPRLRS